MSSGFDSLYKSELSFLRALGGEYAEAHPSLMKVFGDGVPDPDVERLLEGFAFLAARIRQRVEHETPAFARTMLDTVFPERPSVLPPATVVKFWPSQKGTAAVHRVRKGAEVSSRPAQGSSCVFRTARELDCLPISVERMERVAVPGGEILTLHLSQPEGPHLLGEGRFRLFIDAPLETAADLILLLSQHTASVRYRDSSVTLERPPSAVTTSADDPNFGRALGQWSPPGYHTMSRLFVHPEELLLVDVDLRDALRGRTATEYRIDFVFENPQVPIPEMTASQLVPNCVEAVNVFTSSAEPIRVDSQSHAGNEHIVRVPQMPRSSAEILSVNSVIGIERNKGNRLALPRTCLSDQSSLDRESSSSLGYGLRWFSSPADGGAEVALWLTGQALNAESRVLSVDVSCSNRDAACGLGRGELCETTPRSPGSVSFENVRPVSHPVRLGFDSDTWQRASAQLALLRSPMIDAETLRRTLRAFLPDARSGRARARTVGRWIHGLESLNQKPIARRRRFERQALGDWVRGVHNDIELDDQDYGSIGEAFLFAAALHQVHEVRREINTEAETLVRLSRSGASFELKRRAVDE